MADWSLVTNDAHSDFNKLRKLLFRSCTEDLRHSTHTVGTVGGVLALRPIALGTHDMQEFILVLAYLASLSNCRCTMNTFVRPSSLSWVEGMRISLTKSHRRKRLAGLGCLRKAGLGCLRLAGLGCLRNLLAC